MWELTVRNHRTCHTRGRELGSPGSLAFRGVGGSQAGEEEKLGLQCVPRRHFLRPNVHSMRGVASAAAPAPL